MAEEGFSTKKESKIKEKENTVANSLIIEVEKWRDTDENGKARTRINVKGGSVEEVYATLDEIIAKEGENNNLVAEETPAPAKATPAKKTWTPGKKKWNGGGAKKAYKKGRNLTKDFEEEPTECPDCQTEMIERTGTKKDGQDYRNVSCPSCGAIWWDNSVGS